MKYKLLISFIFILLFKIYSFQVDYNIDPNEWVQVDSWPLIDNSVNKHLAFYWSRNINDPKMMTWKINPKIFNDLNNDKSIRLSFKIWSSSKLKGSLIIDDDISGLDVLSETYNTKYPDFWMPYERVLTKQQLEKFNIFLIMIKYDYFAIKDLKVEQDITTSNKQIKIESKDKNQLRYAVGSVNTDCTMASNSFETYDNDTFQIQVEEISRKKDTCLKIYYNTKEEIDINLFLSSDDNLKFLNLFQIPGKTFDNFEICLNHFVAIEAKKVNVLFRITSEKSILNHDNFKICVTSNVTPVKDEKKDLFFIDGMTKFDNTNDKFELSSQWNVIPTSSNVKLDINSQKRDYRIHFSAGTNNPKKLKSIIMSEWIVNGKNISTTGAEYNIISTEEAYHAFNVKPKICNWLNYCEDVKFTQFDIKGLSRTFKFDFNPDEKSAYIRLIFEIEYYLPAFAVKPVQIDFDLKVFNFGDKCNDGSQYCQNNGLCISESLTGNIKCDCTPGDGTGTYCKQINNCKKYQIKEGKKYSGEGLCGKVIGKKCINLESDYVCDCNEGQNIYYDDTNKFQPNCKEPVITYSSWKDGKLSDKELNEGTIEMEINNIDSNKNDFCFKFNYQSSSIQKLNVFLENTKIIKDMPLKDTPKDVQEYICLMDYIFDLPKQFKLKFIIGDKTKNFKLINPINYYKKPIDKDLTKRFITYSSWNNKLDDDWSFIPNTITVPKFKDGLTLKDNPEGENIWIISKWISFTNIDDFKKYSKYTIKGADNKLMTMFVYFINEKGQWSGEDDGNVILVNSEEKTYDFQFNNLKNVGKYFKIIISIQWTKKQVNELHISSVSVGDACLQNDICNGNNCTTSGPGLNSINCGTPCKNQKIGKFCNISACTNEQIESCAGSILPFNSLDEERCLNINDYECKCETNSFFWDKDLKRCHFELQYKTNKVECNDANCNIMDIKIGETSKPMNELLDWSNENMPQFTVKDNLKDKLPMIFTNKPASKMSINVKNPLTKDPCFNLLLINKNINSSLVISYENNKGIEITNTELSGGTQKICASYLTKDINNNFSFNIKTTKPTSDDFIVFHINDDSKYEENQNSDFIPYVPSTYLQPINEIKFTDVWPIEIPVSNQNQWIKDTKSIEFTVKIHFKSTSYLMSKWIKASKTNNSINFNFEFHGKQTKSYLIRFYTMDSQMNMKEIADSQFGDPDYDKQNAKNVRLPAITDSIRLQLEDSTDYFRIVIKVDLDGSKLKDDLFTLTNFDIGDPCVESSVIPTCRNGECNRFMDKENFKCNCQGTKYFGIQCQNFDNCTAGGKESICNGNDLFGKCSNLDNGDWLCDCKKNNSLYWHPTSERCLTFPKCLGAFDPVTEICNDETSIIECNEGYVDVGDGKTLKCEIFDVCVDEHRKKKGYPNIKPCKGTAKCNPGSNNGKPIEICSCNKGYIYTDNGCEPMMCESPVTNICDQKCNYDSKSAKGYNCACYDDKLYDLKDESKCEMKKDIKCPCKDNNGYCVLENNTPICKCKKGLILKSDNICDVDSSVSLKLCPKLNTTVVDHLSCDCGNGFEYKENSCELISICGVKGEKRKTCNDLNALCTYDDTTPCVCPFGKYQDSKECVNFCDYNDRKGDCTKINAVCNPLKNPNVYKKPTEFCDCKPGFVFINGICMAAPYSLKFKLDIANIFWNFKYQAYVVTDKFDKPTSPIYEKDLNGILKDYKENIEENNKLIKTLSDVYTKKIIEGQIKKYFIDILSLTKLKNEIYDLNLMNCDPDEKKSYYTCQFIIAFKQNAKQTPIGKDILTEINNICKLANDKEVNCFIPILVSNPTTYYSTNAPINIFLNHDVLKKSKPEVYKSCNTKDICKEFQYSDCENDKNDDSSYHTCKCNTTFFKMQKTDYIYFSDGSKTDAEHCDVIPYCGVDCHTDKDQHGQCLQEQYQDENGKNKVKRACDCFETYKITKDYNCQASCSGFECKNGKTKVVGNECKCVCDKKYHGENCENEYSPSNGGWIAGIVVLAVLVVLVAGVAFFFARRRTQGTLVVLNRFQRSRAEQYSGSQMDEFSGSAYRVPSQPNRGQSNPSFQRD